MKKKIKNILRLTNTLNYLHYKKEKNKKYFEVDQPITFTMKKKI